MMMMNQDNNFWASTDGRKYPRMDNICPSWWTSNVKQTNIGLTTCILKTARGAMIRCSSSWRKGLVFVIVVVRIRCVVVCDLTWVSWVLSWVLSWGDSPAWLEVEGKEASRNRGSWWSLLMKEDDWRSHTQSSSCLLSCLTFLVLLLNVSVGWLWDFLVSQTGVLLLTPRVVTSWTLTVYSHCVLHAHFSKRFQLNHRQQIFHEKHRHGEHTRHP